MWLYLVRHGQTAWNVAGRAQGHTDIPLDEAGLRQRDRLESAFMEVVIDQIYSSDLARASQTAEAIVRATGAAIQLRSDLRERGFGAWEGDSFLAMQDRIVEEARRLGISPIAVRPPGGESYLDLWERTASFISKIAVSDKNVCIVSHGGTCSVMLAQLVQGNPETARSFRFGNTAICALERRDDGFFRIDRLNDTRHLDLSGDAAPVGATHR